MTRFGRGMSEERVFALLKGGTRIAHVPQSLLRDGGDADRREFVVGGRILSDEPSEAGEAGDYYTDSDPWNGLLSLEQLGLVEQVEEPNGTTVWRIKEGADETKVPRT